MVTSTYTNLLRIKLRVQQDHQDLAAEEWLGETLFEPCAMTCRVSSSFLRVGHLELFARRARDGWGQDREPQSELRQLVMHAMRREYPGPWNVNLGRLSLICC